jgi:hypothetical protein
MGGNGGAAQPLPKWRVGGRLLGIPPPSAPTHLAPQKFALVLLMAFIIL